MNSIRRKLLVWLLAALLACAAALGTAVYRQARNEANDLFDYQLRQLVASLPPPSAGALERPPSADDDVVVRIWDRNGVRLYFSHPEAHLPQRAEIGFATVATADGDWRIFSALVDGNLVQAAQPMRVRAQLAAEVALRTMLPLLLILPLLGIVIWIVVGRGLRPLTRVAAEVGQRRSDSLEALPVTGLPVEVLPLVSALNGLLERLSGTLARQRHFIADAAHELRTPLTALQLQLQIAERADSDATRDAALERLRAGLERANRLVAQLLALARAEPEGELPVMAPVDLNALARAVVAERTPLAQERDIDLGVDAGVDADAPAADGAIVVPGDVEALRVLLGNLVDNALQNLPRGALGAASGSAAWHGRIDVTACRRDGRALLVVSDNGPGIPPAERERVFDRFYRRVDAPEGGSGLGLAIVRRIAQRHGATVTLDERDGGGLVVTVAFPSDIGNA